MGIRIITESPGLIVGTTYYDAQTFGSTGNRIAVCDDGSKYCSWTNLLGWPYPPAPRHSFFNWTDSVGNWYSVNGGRIDESFENTRSGYTTIDVIYSNQGIFVYQSEYRHHQEPTYVTLSIDTDPPGSGYFYHYNPPDEIYPQNQDSPGRLYWPYLTVDRNNNIHIVATEQTNNRLMRMGYTNSTDQGISWSTIQLIDTVMVISSVIDASPVSDKVVIAYSKTQDTTTVWKNDIVYILSVDGLS